MALLLPQVAAQANESQSLTERLNPSNYVEIEGSETTVGNRTAVFNSETGLNLPMGYIGLILSFIGIVLYSFDIDPLPVVGAMLYLGYSAVVYYAGLPILIIPVPLAIYLGVRYLK